MGNDPYNLERIAESYKILLFDASAILSPFQDGLYDGQHSMFARDGKTAIVKRETDYILYLQEFLRRGYPFYITPKVKKEIGGGNPNLYKTHIRGSKKRKMFVSPKTIAVKESEENRLASFFENTSHILQLTDSEKKIYLHFYSCFNYLKGRFDLSESDSDFLISGMAVVKSRGATALLTNDSGIRNAWFHVVRKIKFNPFELELFKSTSLRYFVNSRDYPEERKRVLSQGLSIRLH